MSRPCWARRTLRESAWSPAFPGCPPQFASLHRALHAVPSMGVGEDERDKPQGHTGVQDRQGEDRILASEYPTLKRSQTPREKVDMSHQPLSVLSGWVDSRSLLSQCLSLSHGGQGTVAQLRARQEERAGELVRPESSPMRRMLRGRQTRATGDSQRRTALAHWSSACC